jgi:phage gp36-like protein
MPYCTVADVKALARLGPADTLDDARAAVCVTAASELIDAYLGWPVAAPTSAPTPADLALLQLAATQVALELLRRPAYGITGAYDDAGAVRVGADVLAGVTGILAGVGRTVWGMA